ncbi:hypothetical protein PUR49_07950 [Streptomyces sp. BE147]|uniref:hypothetical protein n=1 Tax=Streptomyces sp. BE147 TaxID=3002524 RepID=UPI002E788FC5|nr:hypothetical protein [Streptomyces sp. BE147]MEE1736431.1 hypothetical protein [Streptomyces sp. BE147]
MGSTPGWIPFALSLVSSLTVFVAAATTMRAILHARACSSQALELRQQAVAHWVAAVLVTVVLTVVRRRLEASEGADDGHDGVSVPWRAIALWGVGVLVVASFVVFVLVMLRAWRRRRVLLHKAQRAHEAVQSRVQAVEFRHDAVLTGYGAVLVDFLAALEHPALYDSRIAQTERFDRARIDADDARIALQIDGECEQLERYHQAVTELEVAWRGAQDHARRVGTSYLGPAVARRLEKAVDLVAVVRGGGSEHEKALAYERIRTIRRLVGSAVRIPQQAELTIERLARPVLTAAAITDGDAPE